MCRTPATITYVAGTDRYQFAIVRIVGQAQPRGFGRLRRLCDSLAERGGRTRAAPTNSSVCFRSSGGCSWVTPHQSAPFSLARALLGVLVDLLEHPVRPPVGVHDGGCPAASAVAGQRPLFIPLISNRA